MGPSIKEGGGNNEKGSSSDEDDQSIVQQAWNSTTTGTPATLAPIEGDSDLGRAMTRQGLREDPNARLQTPMTNPDNMKKPPPASAQSLSSQDDASTQSSTNTGPA